MKFEIKYTDELSTGIILNDDGTITFFDAKAVEGQFVFSTPVNDYGAFITTLNCLYRKYPQIYDIVYNHIKDREEMEYNDLKDYCKFKSSNGFTKKLTK